MIDDFVLLVTGLTSAVILVLLGFLIYRSFSANATKPTARPVAINREDAGQPRRVRRNVRNRMQAARLGDDDSGDEDDGYGGGGRRDARPEGRRVREDLEDLIDLPEGKIGAKKLRKLEAKAEKKLERERMLEDREDEKRRKEEADARRKAQEEKEREAEKLQEEKERKEREEQERREQEEYERMKAEFAIEDEGCEEQLDENAEQDKLQEFISYIETEKVVVLEDLAAKFRLKTQECIDRVQQLLTDGQIIGVIDDRGKFISITNQELEAVATFIKQRGRVSITELAENSNRLIALNVSSSTAAQIAEAAS